MFLYVMGAADLSQLVNAVNGTAKIELRYNDNARSKAKKILKWP